MSGWLRHHWLSFVQTMRRLATAPLASLLNVLVIGVALALPLGGYVLLGSLQQFAGSIVTDAQISVFLAPDATKADASELEKRLRGSAGVQSVEFVDRDKALAGLRRMPGMAEVVATLRDNPLPDAFVLTFTANDMALVQGLEREFSKLPKVTHVQTDSAWVQRVNSLIRFSRTAILLLAALLAFALVAVTFNTIRLQILTQRDEIEVAKLIGATDAYIRRPFFYLGILQGALGGLIACTAVGLGIVLLNRDLAGIGTLYGTDARLQLLDLGDCLRVLAFSGALGWLGAYISVSKHLSTIEPQ
jgi:cell division transport system permease protein